MLSHPRLRADCICRAEFQLDKFGFLHGDEYSTDHSIGTARVAQATVRARAIRRGLQEDRSIQESTSLNYISPRIRTQASRVARVHACPKIPWSTDGTIWHCIISRILTRERVDRQIRIFNAPSLCASKASLRVGSEEKMAC